MSNQSLFLLSQNVSLLTPQNNIRHFKGIANSGQPFEHDGKPTIVDLNSLSYHDKIPALLLHDREKRIGFGSLKVKNQQLWIEGTLLDNEHANAIATEADKGFPWQMSAHVQAGTVEDLAPNQTAEVNGQLITAPMRILRHCHIPEVSFTPTGVDNNTSAVILSDQPQAKPKGTSMNPTELEQLKAEIEQLKKQLADVQAENTTLKAEKQKAEAQAKQTAIDAELSNHGFRKNSDGQWQGISANTLNVLLSVGLDDAKAMIADFSAKPHSAPAQFLFSEQFPQGKSPDNRTTNPLLELAKQRQV